MKTFDEIFITITVTARAHLHPKIQGVTVKEIFMKASAFPAQAELHLASDPLRYPYAEYTAELQDLFSHAMDRALGIQKASLDAVVKMQSNVIEMQKHVYEGEPAISNFANLASEAVATCLEIQLTWLNLMVASAQAGLEMWLQLAGMGIMFAGSSEEMPMPMRAMDISLARAAS